MASSMRQAATDKLRIRAVDDAGRPAAHVRVELVAPSLPSPASAAPAALQAQGIPSGGGGARQSRGGGVVLPGSGGGGDPQGSGGGGDPQGGGSGDALPGGGGGDNPQGGEDGAPQGGGATGSFYRTDLIAIRSLITSRDGFAIFSLADIPPAVRDGLFIRFAGRLELTYAIATTALAGGSHYVGYQLPEAPPWAHTEGTAGSWFDESLDADDVRVTPGVFSSFGDLEFGDDYCSRLIPDDRTVRIFDYKQLVRTKKDVKGCRGPDDRPIILHEGELIQFETKSTRLGYTFGDLLYSLPLAPCESVTLAISHWEQRQQARAEQQSDTVQKQRATYDRQNVLSEVLSAASASQRLGGAVTGGFSAGGLIGKVSASIGVSASASASFDRSQFASNATRSFSDSIQQTAEAWRSDHQVVVMEQQETEDQTVSYRTVCNNNHCHVLNIFYHEVLNNFRVTTRMVGHREVYFVPYDVYDFDAPLALGARPALLPYLLDPSLASCFAKLTSTVTGGTTTGTGTATGGTAVNQFKVEMSVYQSDAFRPEWPFELVVKLKVGGLQFSPIKRNEFWAGISTYAYAVDTPDYDPDNIASVGLRDPSAGEARASALGPRIYVTIQSLTVSMRNKASAGWRSVGSRTEQRTLGAQSPGYDGDLYLIDMPQTPATTTPAATTPVPAPAAVDADCLDQVLAHLNYNKTYYSMLLALLEEPNQRICRFDRCATGADGESLADLIDSVPVGVMGCYLAFPKAGSMFVPYAGEPIFDERLLTLPTPGIFADAALGQCQACETKDDKVYWDWKDSPCICGGKDVTLKAPESSPLFASGVSPFPTLTTAWATMAAPPTGEAAITNSLVTSFGSALVTAMLSGTDTSKNLDSIKDTLGKLTDVLKPLLTK